MCGVAVFFLWAQGAFSMISSSVTISPTAPTALYSSAAPRVRRRSLARLSLAPHAHYEYEGRSSRGEYSSGTINEWTCLYACESVSSPVLGTVFQFTTRLTLLPSSP